MKTVETPTTPTILALSAKNAQLFVGGKKHLNQSIAGARLVNLSRETGYELQTALFFYVSVLASCAL
jgi:hypothetical protein